ncbi:MAG: hypothetical protein AAB515_02650 [Patescibacteria group bacterium]
MNKPRIQLIQDEAPLDALQRCGGFYQSRYEKGIRKGLLVGYAGEYEPGMHYVGEVYANFAKAESFPRVLESFCSKVNSQIPTSLLDEVDGFCGAPLGGLATAYQLALLGNRRYSYPEKKVTKAAAGGQREESVLIFGRHEIEVGDDIIIVEDVVNNFTTTEDLIALIKKAGGRVRAIVALLNRSADVDDLYHSTVGGAIPVISLERKKIMQYKQDDPYVAHDVAAGNIIWKPKSDWDRLIAS